MEFYNTKETIELALNVNVDSDKKGNLNIFTIGNKNSGIYDNFLYPNFRKKLGSYIVIDYNNNIYEETKEILISKGFQVKIIDMNTEYNPYDYISNESDVEDMVISIYNNSSSINQEKDIFFIDISRAIFSLVALYVFYKVPKENKKLYHIYKIIKKLKENDCEYFKRIFFSFEKSEYVRAQISLLQKIKDNTYTTALDLIVNIFKEIPISILKCDKTKKIDVCSFYSKLSILYVEMSECKLINSLICRQMQKKLYVYADKNAKLSMPVFLVYNELSKIGYIDYLNFAITGAKSRNIVYIVNINNIDKLNIQYRESLLKNIINGCDYGVIFRNDDLNDIRYISNLISKGNLESLYNNICRAENGCIVYQKGLKITEEYQIDGMNSNYDLNEMINKNKNSDDEYTRELWSKIESITQKKSSRDSNKKSIKHDIVDDEVTLDSEIHSTVDTGISSETQKRHDISKKHFVDNTEKNEKIQARKDILESLKQAIDNESDGIKKNHLQKIYDAFINY